MTKKLVILIGVIVLSMGGISSPASATRQQSDGGMAYASLPDEAALYLNDIAFVRDTVTLPSGDVRVLLPPGTFPNTLLLTENGARVHNYRIAAQGADAYYSQAAFRRAISAYGGGGSAYVVTWSSDSTSDTREVKLEYLMSGAYWTPSYDAEIVDDEHVKLAFFAEIQDSALVMDDTTVYLLAARVDLSQQVDQMSQVTMNQYAVGYANESVALPALGISSVDLQYIYPVGQVTAEPGDSVYVNVVDTSLNARRVHVWNAGQGDDVSVIYKVMNDTQVPLAEGIVRCYQGGLFVGSDFIETTPVGSEGSVTVGHLPDMRVHRSESQEFYGEVSKDYYLHTVKLEIQNFGQEAVSLIVLDPWQAQAWSFEFSAEPARQPDNLLRWEITLQAGESQTITYTFRTEY